MSRAEGLLNQRDGARDWLTLRGDGIGDGTILGVHEVDDLQRGGEIDVGAPRIAALGDPRIEHEGGGERWSGVAGGGVPVSYPAS